MFLRSPILSWSSYDEFYCSTMTYSVIPAVELFSSKTLFPNDNEYLAILVKIFGLLSLFPKVYLLGTLPNDGD